MGINSRNKGSKNERKAAGLLTAWTKRKFERTPSSGGLNWKASFSKGDVVCTAEGHLFPFCVEVKAHKEIDFSHLLVPGIKNIKILEFWGQCQRDAERCKKVPMLLMRYDRLPSDFFFLGIPYSFYEKLPLSFKMYKKALIYKLPNLKIAFLPSELFFALPYKEVKTLAKDLIKTLYK